MQNADITLRSLGSAFDDDTGGRAISHPLSSLLVEGCPCGADLSSAFGAPLLQGAALLACKNAICERNPYSPKYENTASLTFPFTPLREPTSAPSGHLLPTEGTYTLSPAQKPSPLGKVASKARRIGQWRYDNERKSVSSRRCGRLATQEYSFPQRRYKKTQPMRAALSDFKNYTLKRK